MRKGQRWGGILLSLLIAAASWRSYPTMKPLLLQGMKRLALGSVITAQPKDSLSLWKEQLLPAEESTAETEPVLPTEKPMIKEESPPVEEAIPVESVQNPETPEPIPEEYQAPIIEETMSGQAKTGFPSYGAALIKNSTALSDEEVLAIMKEEHQLPISTEGPQVLIYHTHATESYEPYDSDVYDTRHTWRSIEETENMIAVGKVIANAIEAHGIEVIHDHTLHDYPSYNGSYERSAVTIEAYLEQYPSICVALDIHRDAIQREDTLVKPVAVINGTKTAQLMLIAGYDDGSLGIPYWKDNLRFGARLQHEMESRYPGLCRPLFFTGRKYNQHLTNASLLFEIGSHGNTLEEALACGQMAGDAIGAYLSALLNSEEAVIPLS